MIRIDSLIFQKCINTQAQLCLIWAWLELGNITDALFWYLTDTIWDQWVLHLDLTMSRLAYMSTVKWDCRFFLERFRDFFKKNMNDSPGPSPPKYNLLSPFVEIFHVWFYTFVQSGLSQSRIPNFTNTPSPPTKWELG